MNWILRGGRVVDPEQDIDEIRDVAIQNGVFVQPEALSGENTQIQDCTGLVVTPGLIDLHVHLREPGQCWKETIATGTAAALAGGFTTIVAMPNTLPAVDSLARLQEMEARFQKDARVKVLQSVCLTQERAGKAIAAIGEVGQVYPHWLYTDDGATPQDDALMQRIMAQVAKVGGVVIDHCEDKALSAGGVMHEGVISRKLGLRGQPRSAEERIVARDIAACRETGCRLHLQHLSSAGSVEMIRAAQKEGLPVTGEATPHHLLLTDEACAQWGPNAKMAPPLREERDRRALIEGIRDGVLTVIASDHAPHTQEEKARGWTEAPFGIVGIEAEAALVYTELCVRQNISFSTMVSCFTKGPRSLCKRPLGALRIGEPADITIWNLHAPFTVQVNQFKSMGRNCPYDGMQCAGRPVFSFLNGELRYGDLLNFS